MQVQYCWAWSQMDLNFNLTLALFSFFFFGCPVAYGNSWARDRISATAVTCTTAAATQDLLTHCTSLGIKSTPL